MVLLNLLQFDVFGFVNSFFILGTVIAIIVFVLVIIIIYKLLHSNVNNVRTKSKFNTNQNQTNPYIVKNVQEKKEDIPEKKSFYCQFCGAELSKKSKFCPICGAEIKSF